MERLRTLGLQLPERTSLPDGSFLANPREVEAWISGLPMANIGETSRQIFKMIVEFNRLEIPNTSRIKIAELLRRPIRYLSDNLRKYYFDTAFPLSAKSHKTAVLNRELYIELAITYKIFIEETLSGEIQKFDNKFLVIAIHRALNSLSLVLYQSVLFYDPYPRNIWREIHRLYGYAEKNKVHQLQIKGDEADNLSTSTIEDLYQRILLFAISSPYRLRQPDIERVYSQLPAWSKQVSITTPGQKNHSETLFIARLDEDAPPTHIKLQSTPLDKSCRQIDTGSLVALLQNVLESIPSEQSRSEQLTSEDLISRNLLQKLITTFSTAQERKFVRTHLNFELRTASGLTAIHSLLPSPEKKQPDAGTAQETPAPELDQLLDEVGLRINSPRPFTLTEQSEATLGMLDDPQEESIIMTVPVDDSGDLRPYWTNAAGEKTAAPFACKTDNESAGGFCILWHGSNAPKIKIGEIIGILSATQDEEFAIGISRWLRSIPGRGLQVGMEMVAQKSRAVLGRAVGSNQFPNTEQKCLLLYKANASSDMAEKIITPPLAFRVGDRLQLNDRPQGRELRLTALVESTGAFALFDCISVNRPQQNEVDNSHESDSIWPSI